MQRAAAACFHSRAPGQHCTRLSSHPVQKAVPSLEVGLRQAVLVSRNAAGGFSCSENTWSCIMSLILRAILLYFFIVDAVSCMGNENCFTGGTLERLLFEMGLNCGNLFSKGKKEKAANTPLGRVHSNTTISHSIYWSAGFKLTFKPSVPISAFAPYC